MGYLLRDLVSKPSSPKNLLPFNRAVFCPVLLSLGAQVAGIRPLALKGVLCIRGWAVGKVASDQDLEFSGCFLLPGFVRSVGMGPRGFG